MSEQPPTRKRSRWSHLEDDDKEEKPTEPSTTTVDKGKRRATKAKSPEKASTAPSPTKSSGDNEEERCSICLQSPMQNKAFADTCLHSFCKTCLFEWAKVKPECPVCRQPFSKLPHDATEGSYEHKETPVPARNNHSPSSFMMHLLNFPPQDMVNMFRENYRASALRIGLRIGIGGQAPSLSVNMVEPLANYGLGSSVFSLPTHAISNSMFPPAMGTAEHRRYLYRYNLWVQPSRTGRYRDTSPTFLKNNPAVMHRLQPFLNRELIALLEGGENIRHIQGQIMVAVGEYSIRSRRFRRIVEPYTLENTDHFIHEFYNFARSTHDMHAYDRHVNYVPKQRLTEVMSTQPPILTGPGILYEDDDSDEDLSNSDVDIVDTPDSNMRRPSKSKEPELIVLSDDDEDEAPINVVSSTPEPAVTASTDSNTASAKAEPVDFSNPRPGPSGVNTKLLFPRPSADQARRRHDSSSSEGSLDVGRDVAFSNLLRSRYGTNEQPPQNDEDSNDSVCVIEPPPKPVPQVIDILSEEEEEDEPPAESKRKCESPEEPPVLKRIRTITELRASTDSIRQTLASNERRPAVRSVILPSATFRSNFSLKSEASSSDEQVDPMNERRHSEGAIGKPRIKSVIARPTLLSNMEDFHSRADSPNSDSD